MIEAQGFSPWTCRRGGPRVAWGWGGGSSRQAPSLCGRSRTRSPEVSLHPEAARPLSLSSVWPDVAPTGAELEPWRLFAAPEGSAPKGSAPEGSAEAAPLHSPARRGQPRPLAPGGPAGLQQILRIRPVQGLSLPFFLPGWPHSLC